MSHYDQKNFGAAMVAFMIATIVVFMAITAIASSSNRRRIAEEETDRAKVEVCETIEDAAERTLCLTAVKR